ncbi:L-seryl-tRNA(Sec) selenium transferase [Halanaerobacter jeridensis]|uniref:L-seryl-tRNA(Sec) selenium transferase n=1 Tax=Halanaerobacter jeridensis TaxID=706427 RepID=A0A938XNP2_9FIRM|nr:L-seryl-tRNA(Sec) selenium transferase [Halanaerobacter jeridensis]MBM7555732.1 L-seryl-tRNA(Ser) seleniumtransferase [Halanaerobacter jeridensis]
MDQKRKNHLRSIPAVNDLLAHEQGEKLVNDYSHELVVEAIREVTEELRGKIFNIELSGLKELKIDSKSILAQVQHYLESKMSDQLLTAVNATGVVVHTNLGRSLLCDAAKDKLLDVASNYSTLEINRDTGERGSRYELVEELLTELTGAEAALVVNNNAAAVLLAVSALASGQEAIIARGQLVEIGGSFRIPEVMEQGGAELRGIGTTNRVHLADYKNAINEETGMILKVHTSNYRVVGFSKEVELEELVDLGTQYELPVVEDLGSGVLLDLRDEGLSYEQTVQDCIAAGADVVTFSGDKLLGGPQAGIIVGQEEYIEQMKSHPLNRALRVDKFTLGSLEATLQQYRDLEQAKEKIPTLEMITRTQEQLKTRAQEFATELEEVITDNLTLEIKQDSSRVGGGAYPNEGLPTYVLALEDESLTAEELAEELRLHDPPIFSRISDEQVILDVRTLQSEDEEHIISAVQNLSIVR